MLHVKKDAEIVKLLLNSPSIDVNKGDDNILIIQGESYL